MVTLATIVLTINLQDRDIRTLRHQAFSLEGGLHNMYGGLRFLSDKIDRINGGLDSTDGGLVPTRDRLAPELTLYELRARTVVVTFLYENWNGPIMSVKEGGGSGTFVSDNLILTCKHVVENRIDDYSVTVTTEDGQTFAAVAVYEDKDDDLALIEIVGRIGPHLAFGPSPHLGADLILIGAPFNSDMNRQLTIHKGYVSREKYENYFLLDSFVWHGMSGGPVIHDGKLVGVTTARRAGVCGLGYATPVHRLDAELMGMIHYLK
jgi:hypothetical protein